MRVPGIAIQDDLYYGFPSETKEDFEWSWSVCARSSSIRIGVFSLYQMARRLHAV